MEFPKPDYDRAIFRLLPTILTENFGLDLDHPHDAFRFKQKSILSRFEESEITLIMIYDALSVDDLTGKMLEFWKENGAIELSSIVPTLTGPAILSLNTGLPPEYTGFMNTKVYVPEIGNFVNMLKGIAVDAKVPLEDAGVRLRSLMWEKPVIDYIPDDYIMFDLLPYKIVNSKGLRAFYGYRYQNCGYENEVDALYILKRLLEHLDEKSNRALITAYFSGIDTTAHDHGINNEAWRDVLDTYYQLTKGIISVAEKLKRRVSIYFVSDHGLEAIEQYAELDREQLEGFLTENNIQLFSKSGRFAMIYADELDIEAVERFFQNKVKIVETEKVLKDFWPLAEKQKFLERAGKYTVIFNPKSDVVAIDTEKLAENPLIADILEEMRKLKANHGAPSKKELKSFFASYINR